MERGAERLPQPARFIGRAPPLGKIQHLEYVNGAVERHGHHIAGAYRATGRINPLAIDTHMSRCGKRSCGRARAHDPRVPQPFVDALAFQDAFLSAAPWRPLPAALSALQAWRMANWGRAPDRVGQGRVL